ncbi:MAG TPA: hypothetical protein VF860_01380 [Candidatus Acidoferrales bacterium]
MRKRRRAGTVARAASKSGEFRGTVAYRNRPGGGKPPETNSSEATDARY